MTCKLNYMYKYIEYILDVSYNFVLMVNYFVPSGELKDVFFLVSICLVTT